MALVTRFSIIKVHDDLSDWPDSKTYRSLTLFFCVHLRCLNIGFSFHKRIKLVGLNDATVFQLAL
jgi:hypothetical protein